MEAHRERARVLTATWRGARERGEKHEIEDFLFSYYPVRPARLEAWAPGVGRALRDAEDRPEVRAEVGRRAQARWMRCSEDDAGRQVELDRDAYLADRGSAVRYMRNILAQTLTRPASVGCFGLHEWAMVYRDEAPRHVLPLRLGTQGTNDVVEAHNIRCTHIDAFRFFTPSAVGRNRWQLTRETQPAMEQPGCLHANMDLYKWAWKLTPAVPGDLLLDCFELSREIRYLDMQASPYDVSQFGLDPVPIETTEGKAEYVRRQRDFAARSEPLRRRLVDVCDAVLQVS
nr:hypothetical protein [Jonesia quinghaiensis]